MSMDAILHSSLSLNPDLKPPVQFLPWLLKLESMLQVLLLTPTSTLFLIPMVSFRSPKVKLTLMSKFYPSNSTLELSINFTNAVWRKFSALNGHKPAVGEIDILFLLPNLKSILDTLSMFSVSTGVNEKYLNNTELKNKFLLFNIKTCIIFYES